jgi:BCD family chlorophyll transporter-like MFS transporter
MAIPATNSPDLPLNTAVETPETDALRSLSFLRNLKIGLFHLGSGMADVLATGVWNRIMITDLGFAATPIGLLVALRYFLAPVGIWAGRKSDEREMLGYRRLFWIWLGRAMMVLSVIMLGLSTANLARGYETTALTWAALASALLLFSLGNAISGSTFLALVYDRSSESQRTRAVGIVWTFLLLGFTVGGLFFGILLPAADSPSGGSYSPETLETLFLVAAGVMAALWFFSLLGEERRNARALSRQDDREQISRSIIADLKIAWANRSTRYFFWFLGLSMMFAFSQDLILEPFAGDVFEMSARVTTRFAAYWGVTAILSTIIFIAASRRFKRLTNTTLSAIGVGALVFTFALLAVSSIADIRQLVTPALISLGIGLGIWNVGALGLMMDMSPLGRAGAFLGFWTLVVTLARGIGVSGGGILRDVFLALTGSMNLAYGIAFGIGALGLALSLWALTRVQAKQFRADQSSPPTPAEQVFAGGLD